MAKKPLTKQKQMKKFKFLLAAMVLSVLTYTSCSKTDDIVNSKKLMNSPIFVSLDGINKSDGIVYEDDYDNPERFHSRIKLDNFSFQKDFKVKYKLKKYNQIVQVIFLSKLKNGSKTTIIKNKDIDTKLVYYKDNKNNVILDIIEKDIVTKSYNNISAIHGVVVMDLLLTNKDIKKPFIIIVDNKDASKKNTIWAEINKDKLFKITQSKLGFDTYYKQEDPDGCFELCEGYTGACYVKDGNCGGCRVEESVLDLQSNATTRDSGNSLFLLLSELRTLRDKISLSNRYNYLIDNFYNVSLLASTKRVEVPLNMSKDFGLLILRNKQKVLDLINPQMANSSQILFNSNDAQQYLDFIQTLRSTLLNDNLVEPQSINRFNRYLDSFESVVLEFQNKSIYEINQSLSN